MHRIDFSEEDRARIFELRFQHPDPRVLRRMQILLLKMHDMQHAQIALLSGLSRSTVQRVLRTYAKRGLRTVLFVDASHMVLGTFLCCLWSVMPQFIRAASGRQRYNVLGAINPLTLDFYRVCNTTYINSLSVCELLRQIASAGIATPITLILDNARYQRCKLVENLAQELNIELLFLPSYSPNLNLIERLWKFVKKEALNSKHHTTFDDFRRRIDDCLNQLSNTHREALTQLLTLKFQTFENATVLAS